MVHVDRIPGRVEPTLADLEQEFPRWACWRGGDGQCYARRQQTPHGQHDARGEDPPDLREAVILAMSAPPPGAPGQLPGDDDMADAADLDTLADELSALGCTAILLMPPGQPPRVDVSLPGDMTPGEQVRAQAGTFFWRGAQPISPSDEPAAAAAAIARALLRAQPPPR